MQSFARDFRRIAFWALFLALLGHALAPAVFSADDQSSDPGDLAAIVIQPRVARFAGRLIPPPPQPVTASLWQPPPEPQPVKPQSDDYQPQAAASTQKAEPSLPVIIPQPVHRPTYSQVYNSIPFRRSEYRANPSYRHEATMEIMFGKLRPTSINRYYNQPLQTDRYRLTYPRPRAYPYWYSRTPFSYYNLYYPRPLMYRRY